MPVDATQTLVAEECARTSGKRLVIEQTFEEIQDQPTLALDGAGIPRTGQFIEDFSHIPAIGDGTIEVIPANHVSFHEQPVAIRNQLPQQLGAIELFLWNVVLLHKLWQMAIRVKQIATPSNAPN